MRKRHSSVGWVGVAISILWVLLVAALFMCAFGAALSTATVFSSRIQGFF